eukprot:UN03639
MRQRNDPAHAPRETLENLNARTHSILRAKAVISSTCAKIVRASDFCTNLTSRARKKILRDSPSGMWFYDHIHASFPIIHIQSFKN